MKNKFKTLAIIAVTLILFGCEYNNESMSSEPFSSTSIPITEEVTTKLQETISITISTITTATTTSLETIITTTNSKPEINTVDIEAETPSFNVDDIPSYSGSPYVEVNGNTPYFDTFPTEVFEIYSPLDSLGRCGVAYANICTDIMPTEPRGEIGMIKPSGWHTVKYNGLIDGNYLYNRCHLIGYQLAGENANELNLITGTRYMNIQGMEPFENKVANYVESYDAHVLYRVSPIFEGNNLVASGVLMEAYSLDDSGVGLKFCVYCYNVQPGIGIDYSNGDSWEIQETATEAQQTIANTSSTPSVDAYTYILNTNTKKFHYPSCSSVEKMKDKNKQEFTGTRDEVISMGFEPCHNCNP